MSTFAGRARNGPLMTSRPEYFHSVKQRELPLYRLKYCVSCVLKYSADLFPPRWNSGKQQISVNHL